MHNMKRIGLLAILYIIILPVSAQTKEDLETWKRMVTIPFFFKLITSDGKVYYTNHVMLNTRTDVGTIRPGNKKDLPEKLQKYCAREGFFIYYLKPDVRLKELNSALADIGIKVTAKDTIYYWHDAMKITNGLPAYVNVDPSYDFRAERRGNVISLGNKWSKTFFRRDVEEGKIKLEKPLIPSPWVH